MTEQRSYSPTFCVGEKVGETHGVIDSHTKKCGAVGCVHWNIAESFHLGVETKDLLVVSDWCCGMPCLHDSWSYPGNRKIPSFFIIHERVFHPHHNFDCTSFFPLFFPQIQKLRRWWRYWEWKPCYLWEFLHFIAVAVNNLTKKRFKVAEIPLVEDGHLNKNTKLSLERFLSS